MKKIINFRFATVEKLMEVVNIKQVINDKKFVEWFNYNYKISAEEENFLKNHINLHRLYLSYYNEQKLTVKFIVPIINKVNFYFKDVQDWYGSEISCELNNFILKGKPDLMVAKGIYRPKTPYFFIQEHKKTINPGGNPQYQVLAEMLAAINLNKTNKIFGSFVIGRIWQFVILEKSKNGNYEYFISKVFDALDYQNLKQIYINLQGVKFLYC